MPRYDKVLSFSVLKISKRSCYCDLQSDDLFLPEKHQVLGLSRSTTTSGEKALFQLSTTQINTGSKI
jgi:hypothetical protein